ncbi:MAG: dynamin family protein [Prochloraceae cyanobacterium]
MYSQHFQTAYSRIDRTGKEIYKYLLDIREDRRQRGNNTEELQSIKEELKQALLALNNQKYQVAVIAAMKAGKSTFLNATIGADILASESEACTVCRTDVRPLPPEETPKLLEFREGQDKPVLISQGQSAIIRQDFLDRTHQIRRTNNQDKTIRFELWHPIAAISQYPALAGFTLVDTPGPNEWESASFNTVQLKETALEALRTCNAILFILDYTSFKDDTNQLLLKDLIEKRKEFIAENTGKIYFILNKVDRRSERDRPLSEVIADLKETLIAFGIPAPVIYPVSAWKGLLSKLIIGENASEIHKRDFIKFFLGEYIGEDFEVPQPTEIAVKALKDSGITTVETQVIQNIISNSGWNLLSEIVAKIDKQAKAIEDTLNQEVWGWEIEFESLKQTVDDFRSRSKSARKKVAAVKMSVEYQKQILIEGFSQGINLFAEEAKTKIQEEIDIIASMRGADFSNSKYSEQVSSSPELKFKETNAVAADNMFVSWEGVIAQSGDTVMVNDCNLVSFIPGIDRGLEISFKMFDRAKTPLVARLAEVIPASFSPANLNRFHFNSDRSDDDYDPFKFKVETELEAKEIEDTINQFCTPLIKSWWVDTQDNLVREGTKIRELLASKIQKDIQEISDELSEYLGSALQVELNINPIQFPSFEFEGIDAKIKEQQETIAVVKTRQEKRIEGGFCNRNVYTVDVSYESEETKSFYEVDIRQTVGQIKNIISAQIPQSQKLLKRVIDRQVSEDFTKAEKQINDYIERSQIVLDRLLSDRQTKEAQADRIISTFKVQKATIQSHLNELNQIRHNLHLWKPLQESSKT